MLDVIINGNYLEIYDSIDELPFFRFQEFNRALLIDTGIGSDFAAFDRHIEQARRYIAAGKQEQADQALLNLRQAISFGLERISPESQAFACLIHKMNGQEISSLSAESAARAVLGLSKKGLTVGKLRGLLERIKKKSMTSLRRFSLN
jgi:hypothetical protein